MPVHPCETFKESLRANKMTWEDFAAKTSLNPAAIEKFHNGESSVDVLLAEQLQKVFGPRAGFWISLQKNYDDAVLAEEKRKEKHASTDHGPTSFVHGELFDLKWMIQNGRRKWKRRIVHEIVGQYHCEDQCDEILCHILKHKWFCGEKGKVFAAKTIEEQVVLAGLDWVEAGYYEEFLKTKVIE